MSGGSAAQLDHVVALLPYKDLIEPPEWITKNFTLSPGGRHADGRTENRLILFRDGTYLELIAFINDDPDKRKGHWWDLDYGIVDYALTTADAYDFDALRHELKQTGTGISYAEPQRGGRTRPDGVEIKWRVTFPTGAQRGEVPFWCHDMSPREYRVPVNETSTTHPCGAIGMSGVVIGIDRGMDPTRLKKAMGAISGNRNNHVSTPLNSHQTAHPSTLEIKQENVQEGGRGFQLGLHLWVPGIGHTQDLQSEPCRISLVDYPPQEALAN